MNNKAQMVMQVLIFILAALVFMLIIAYGYKAIAYFIEKQHQVALADFYTDLRMSIENIKRQPGSVRKVQLNLPSTIQGVCFLGDNCGQGAKLELVGGTIDMSWAVDSCRRTKANVFLFPRVGDEPQLDIRVDSPGYVCVPNIDGITLRLEGVGSTAKVSGWS